jgi:cobalamin-dependent methionine synthase I
MVKLDFMTVKSHSLTVNLNKCKKVVVFAATLGIEVDRAIEKYSKILQSKASMYHAVGSALIESFCNYVNDAVTENVRKSTRRFSPGYGDLPLECQKDILRALDAERKIGIILSDSLLMSPSKSVTAIIGIK